jgi:hypothetical protein
LQYDFARLDEWVARLTAAAEAGDEEAIYGTFSAMGIGFHPTQWKPKEPMEIAEMKAAAGG